MEEMQWTGYGRGAHRASMSVQACFPPSKHPKVFINPEASQTLSFMRFY